MQFTSEDINHVFDSKIIPQAQNIITHGEVKLVRIIGNVIEARVRTPEGESYEQSIKVLKTPDGQNVEANCSCHKGPHCQHVAAALLAYIQKTQNTTTPVPTPPPTPNPAPNENGLPTTITSWIQRLEGIIEGKIESHPEPIRNPDDETNQSLFRFIYVLSPDPTGKHISLFLCRARLSTNGDVSSASLISELYSLLSSPPPFMREHDEDLIRLFLALRTGAQGGASVELTGKVGAQLLRSLLETKQLLWANSEKDISKGMLYPIKIGPQRNAQLAWYEENERWRLRWQFESAMEGFENGIVDSLFPTEPVFYLNNLVCGELTLLQGSAGIPPRELQAIVLHAPSLAEKDTIAMSQALLSRGLQHIVPIPEVLPETIREDIMPQPCLALSSLQQPTHAFREAEQLPKWQDFALLSFLYDGEAIDDNFGEIITRPKEHGVERIVRNKKAEKAFLSTLTKLGFIKPRELVKPLSDFTNPLVMKKGSEWLKFMEESLPKLIKQGWHISKAPQYRYEVAKISEWYAKVEDNSKSIGNQWFDLELGITINKHRISLLPVLIDLIRNAPEQFNKEILSHYADEEPLLITLPGEIKVALPWGRIKSILNILGELYFEESTTTQIRFSSLDAARLGDLSNNIDLRWSGGEHLREIGNKLSQFGGIKTVSPPRGLKTSLRDYQLHGVSWMQFLCEYDLAGVLADDMGLGKTVQTLAHILLEKESGRLTKPVLVIAPTSLMNNWEDEAKHFTPDLRVLVLFGKDRARHFDQIPHFDLILTTYALLPRDEEKLAEHEYHLVILDESHYIKNPGSKAAQTASILRARHRLCLTGTPLENNLGELWSQFHFLMPGLLGDEKNFNSHFRSPIEKQGDEVRRDLLFRRIKPFVLRRTKDKVAKELPPKTEMIRLVEFSDTQSDLYETMRVAMDKKVQLEIMNKGMGRSQIIILDALLKLRQICCDPRLIANKENKPIHDVPSAKLAELMEMLEELLEEDRKILVFSSFTSMLNLIEQELKKRRIRYVKLTGETENRAQVVKAFQQGEVPIFLISLKAGGVGLNLTAADTVIHYDPWWNPAAENQATDRAWRIGQDKPVFVYKLIAKGTLEEKILVLQKKKAALADAMLNNGEIQDGKITQEDLHMIFGPIDHA
jgi:superfamily II DNA or RNA helicase